MNKKFISKKISNNKGETLVETLFSMLIVVLALVVLAGAIVTASKINLKTKQMDTSFHMTAEGESHSSTVTISHGNGATDRIGVLEFNTGDDNNYRYYEVTGEENEP